MGHLNLNFSKRLGGKCNNAVFCTSLAGQRVLKFKCESLCRYVVPSRPLLSQHSEEHRCRRTVTTTVATSISVTACSVNLNR